MTFAEKIVRLRKLKGITQDEFASAVGVSRQAVYKWECGQSYPEVSKLILIKELFDYSIDQLLDDNFDIPLPEKKKRKRAKKTETAAAEPATVAVPAVEEHPYFAPMDDDDIRRELMGEEKKPAAKPSVKEEPAVAAPVVEPVAEPVAAAPATPAAEESAASPAKKKGLFGLFGRK